MVVAGDQIQRLQIFSLWTSKHRIYGGFCKIRFSTKSFIADLQQFYNATVKLSLLRCRLGIHHEFKSLRGFF